MLFNVSRVTWFITSISGEQIKLERVELVTAMAILKPLSLQGAKSTRGFIFFRPQDVPSVGRSTDLWREMERKRERERKRKRESYWK